MARFSLATAWSNWALIPASSASWVARAASSRAKADCNSRGSMRASSWPLVTLSLKSTLIWAIGPETNDPTLTDWTGLIGPDELTTVSILPVDTATVVNRGTALALRYCWPKWQIG